MECDIMTESKIIEIEIQMDELEQRPVMTIASASEATADDLGWHVLVKASEGQTAVFRVRGADAQSHEVITGVRSITPPNDPNATQTSWSGEFVAGALLYFFTEPLPHGAAFRIEVDTSCTADPVPRGGGHFRVLDEGGGLP